ncbi:hypothetical protein HWV62_34431 [Athelia sp. TMB]|nr:hypothetical protein HWV62_34431 [Athelia sp. TMB]
MCGFFETKELKCELESRKRRKAKQKAKQGLLGRSAPARQTTDSEDIGPKTAPGELEHCTSKAHYLRTSRKGYLCQLAQIERQQARIRAIRVAIDEEQANLLLQEPVPKDPQKHHSFGNSENIYEDKGKLLSTGSGDPALKV